MTISLLLTHSGRNGSLSSSTATQSPRDNVEASSNSDKSPLPQKKPLKFAGFEKLMKKKSPLVGGGNLIVCPMTLISQWKVRLFHAYVVGILVISSGVKVKQVTSI